VTPEAKSAMDGASPSCYYQESALVFLEQTGTARCLGFAQRIGFIAECWDLFGGAWKDLPQQWIVRIARADAA
jgi:hypothetical protein